MVMEYFRQNPTNSEVKAALTRSKSSVAVPYVLQVLLAHFKEQTESLILQADVCVTAADIERSLTLPGSPRLIILGPMAQATCWMVSIESHVTLEATAPPPQDNLIKEEDAAVQHLMETLLEEVGTCMEQLLKAETVQITVADEAAAEATNSTMGICLEGCEEKHLDLLMSSKDDTGKVIRELLDILLDDALSASLQPLAENEHMDTNLAEIEEETVEKHLDHLVSSNKGVADAIRELIDIMFDDALSASLQPLENDQMDTKLDKTEEQTVEKHMDHLVSSNNGVADAIRELIDIMFDDALSASLQPLENEQMDTNLDKTEEETVEKHLDHLVSSNKDVADAIRELLEIMFDDVLSASLQPLEKDVISIIEAEAQPEATENRLNVCLEESQAPENQCLNIEKSHRPEEEKTNKKKTRRGTRGKGRKIFYKKEKYPHDKLDGQRGSRGSSGQTNNAEFQLYGAGGIADSRVLRANSGMNVAAHECCVKRATRLYCSTSVFD
ncbi:hypothetical protein MHYP_G00136970 [Metynnis hypsauchen]